MAGTKVVLIGIGGYGHTFVKEFVENPCDEIELVGAVDPFPSGCQYLEDLNKMGVKIYPDMDSFYGENTAELAVISTPIFLHTPHILNALEHGSNVICEKPLCADEADVEVIKNAKEKAGKFVYIGYQWSYSDAINGLKQDIKDGKLGKLIEMKTLVLRPRDRNYFGRGVGWAGKIRAANGALVYDSVANNSAAHYLFNMQYIMGDYGSAAEAQNVKAELLRANEIENFDVSKIEFNVPCGAKACFIAAHPVNQAVEPIFEYKFEKGTVYYSSTKLNSELNLLPEDYTEWGDVVAFMNDGSKKVYGNPMANAAKKMYIAANAASEGRTDDGMCGLMTAAQHTYLINKIQKNYEIYNIKQDLLREDGELLYAEGLFEAAVDSYKDLSKSLMDFAER